MKRAHAMPFGASRSTADGVRFRLWAPAAHAVDAALGRRRGADELSPCGAAGRRLVRSRRWQDARRRHALPLSHRRRTRGARSRLALQSRRTCTGPARSSIRRAFDWDDDDWRGRPVGRGGDLRAARRHVHAEGTFARRQVKPRLPRRARRDGDRADAAWRIFPGGATGATTACCRSRPTPLRPPDDLKALVAGGARRGLMVLLDVVYNHFGPEGNYLHAYAPQFFTERHHTPWGAAINFDGAACAHGARLLRPQRALLAGGVSVSTACAWTRCTRSPTIRPPHILTRDRAAVRRGPGRERARASGARERPQRAALPRARPAAPRCYTAQWNDDFHHALHVLLTGETDGYYADYADAPCATSDAACRGLRLSGRALAIADGAPRGEPSARCRRRPSCRSCRTTTRSATAPSASASRRSPAAEALRLAPATLLLAPSPPLLFMGEEFAAAHALPVLLRLRWRARAAP